MGKKKSNNPSLPSTEKAPLNSEQKTIVEWLKKVRFRKQLFGGVSEQDVWKKIDELNKDLHEFGYRKSVFKLNKIKGKYSEKNMKSFI